MPADFLDSNILIYAFTSDPRSGRALELLAGDCLTSVQGLNEFANVGRRKLGMDWTEIKLALASLRAVLRTVTSLDLETHERAVDLAQRYNLAFFDALIVAAALAAGSATLWSEDMQHGMVIADRLRIANPFAPT